MTGSGKLAFALCLFCGMHASAHAQAERGEARGKLLYSNHCAACHAQQVHWREKRLVQDRGSLEFQVRRWQASIGLDWTENDIADVVRYLNAAYYGFPYAVQKDFLESQNRLRAPPKN